MENQMEATIVNVAKNAIKEAISAELIGYNKPLSRFVNAVMEEHAAEFKSLINEGVSELLNSNDFKAEFKTALHEKLAKVLISKIGGDLEKKINDLKQNPETRAKITLAVSNVMNDILEEK